MNLSVPLPHLCPPGVSCRKWGLWDDERRRIVLLEYWQTLPVPTRRMLDRKYGLTMPYRRGGEHGEP